MSLPYKSSLCISRKAIKQASLSKGNFMQCPLEGLTREKDALTVCIPGTTRAEVGTLVFVNFCCGFCSCLILEAI